MGATCFIYNCYLFRKCSEETGQTSDEVENGMCDGIQECLETVRDLRANSAEDDYMVGLDKKIKAVEKHSIVTELGTAVFVASAR